MSLKAVLVAAVVSTSATFHLYPATGGKNSPILIYVHGGAWVSGSKSDYVALAKSLASSRVCVVVAEYRLAPQHPHPTQISDLVDTLAEVQKLKTSSCNPKEVFLMGHSAGAHMIAFWGSQHLDEQVKGFIGVEGIYDLPKLAAKWPSYKGQFLQSEFGNESKWTAYSPTRLSMKNTSPWLVIHSKSDELVDPAQSEDFYKHLLNQKISAEYLLEKSQTHFGVIDSIGTKDSPLAKRILSFIDDHSK